MGNLTLRSKINEFEASMQLAPSRIDAADLVTLHHFTDNGLYARELILPAGVIISGKVKKSEYISVISAGSMTEVTEAGRQRIRAPYTMVCAPDTKRLLWAHTKTVWVTIHKVTSTDLEAVEAEIIGGDEIMEVMT